MPALLGSGEITDRYGQSDQNVDHYGPQPLPPLPWYYNQTITSTIAIVAIASIITIGFI
jgi:hypothetical protein